MATPTTSKATALAVLSATTESQLVKQEYKQSAGAPLPSDGTTVPNTIIVTLGVALRQDPRFFSTRIKITTLDLTQTYSVTVAGTTVSYDSAAQGASDVSDVINGLASALSASAPILALADCTAVKQGGSTTVNQLLIKSNVSATATHVVSASVTLPAVLEVKEDLVSTDFRIWAKSKDELFPYVLMRQGQFSILDNGFTERLEVNMFERIYIETFNEVSPTPSQGEAQIGLFLGV